MNRFIVIHSWTSDGGGGGIDTDYFETLADAQKHSYSGDIITVIIEEK